MSIQGNNTKLKTFLSNNKGILQGIGVLGSSMNFNQPLSQNASNTKSAISGAIGQMGPYGAAISAGTGLLDGISNIAGISLNDVDKNVAEEAGINVGFNNVLASIPGLSFLGGFASKTKEIGANSNELNNVLSAYSGYDQDYSTAANLGDKRFFGASKANKFIKDVEKDQKELDKVAKENILRKQSNSTLYANQNRRTYTQGYNTNISLAKFGMQFQSAREILRSNEIPSFKNGGKINIIVDGELHARKHDIDLEDITKKGIPVIAISDDKIFQTAEIEKEELVLTKMVSNKLLEFKNNNDPLSAGKLLSEELVLNIEDKTGDIIKNPMTELTVNGKNYKVLVSESDEEKSIGLQKVSKLESDEGMLFVFDDEDEVEFWMKDTSIPLDIVFIDSDNIVISVKSGIPESEDIISEEDVNYVLEVNANSGIKEGMKIECNYLMDTGDIEENSNSQYILDEDGDVQMVIEGEERIFSRKNTKTLISMARKAYDTKSRSNYIKLGNKVFEYIDTQDSNEQETVELK